MEVYEKKRNKLQLLPDKNKNIYPKSFIIKRGDPKINYYETH